MWRYISRLISIQCILSCTKLSDIDLLRNIEKCWVRKTFAEMEPSMISKLVLGPRFELVSSLVNNLSFEFCCLLRPAGLAARRICSIVLCTIIMNVFCFSYVIFVPHWLVLVWFCKFLLTIAILRRPITNSMTNFYCFLRSYTFTERIGWSSRCKHLLKKGAEESIR